MSKKVISIVLVLLSIVTVLLGCSNTTETNPSSTKPSSNKPSSTDETYIIINGEKQSFDYLKNLTNAQIKSLQYKDTTVVSTIEDVGGVYYRDLGLDFDSCVKLKTFGVGCCYIDTTGYEDQVSSWGKGDLVEVRALPFFFGNDTILIHQRYNFNEENTTIYLKNLTKGETVNINITAESAYNH